MALSGWLDGVLSRVSIATRLVGAFVIVLLLLGAAVGFSLHQSRSMSERSQSLVSERLRTISLAHQAQDAARTGAALLYSLLLLEDRDQRVVTYRRIDTATATRERAIGEIVGRIPAGQSAPAIAAVVRARNSFVPIFDRTVEAVEVEPGFARRYMVQATMPALDGMLAALDELVAFETSRAHGVVREIRAEQARASRLSSTLSVLCLLLAMALAAAITRSLARPLARTADFAMQVARGNLAATLPEAGRDEVGVLVRSLDTMRQGIIEREQRISLLAYTDSTTGLPNRALLQDRLRQSINVAMRTGQPLSIMLMDLDRFRDVNDVLGHPAGDALLEQVALRLKQLLRRDSDTLARMGGDEFAVLLPIQGADDAIRMAQRILSALSTPVGVRDQAIDVSVSIGIAVSPEHGSAPEQLLARADTAMYVAKDTGEGYALFDSTMEKSGSMGLSLLGELRRALESEEFHLFLQPKIDVVTGRCTGAEALLRWLPRDRALVPPDTFIPFAEQTGFIRSLTRWVVTRGCRICAEFQGTPFPFSLSVNVSTRDLMSNDFARVVADAVASSRIDPGLLTLEITESAIMADPGQALAMLNALNAVGVRLAIDDFGTGYSSLAYLKRLPVKELKIDQTFVRNLPLDADDDVIVKSTIELAHNLGLTVVAEGVETDASLARLTALGCDSVQGYLFSRPLPVDEFRRWLGTRHPQALEEPQVA